MKNLASVFVVAVAVMAMSCAGNSNKPAEVIVVDETEIVADSTACCADSTCCADSAACAKTAEACAAK